MATITRIETRKRGIFGWIFLTLFWAFNALMAFGLFGGISSNMERAENLGTEAEKAGFAIGTAIGASGILLVWVLGAILLGICVMLTKGKKIIVERTDI